MSCSCEKCGGSVAEKLLRVLFCAETNSCFVQKVVGKALPIMFWLSILGSFALSCKIANFNSMWGGGFDFSTFIVALIAFLVIVLLTFYFIYLVRDIRDANRCCCGGESECCTTHSHDACCAVETKNAEAPKKSDATKKETAKPVTKRTRKKAE